MSAALLLALALGNPCADFAAEVARRAELMAGDVETMPHVVREGLRQLAHDARACEHRDAALERLREEMREALRRAHRAASAGPEARR